MTDATPAQSSDREIVMLPAGRFFVRTIPLAGEIEPGAQVALALENLAPFPLAQLYHGWVPAKKGDGALVFAAYRKRFSAGDAAAWAEAGTVVPEFLALLGDAPDTPTVRILRGSHDLAAAVWDGTGELPRAVMVREVADGAGDAGSVVAALIAEIKSRAGLESAAVREFTGPVSFSRTGQGGLVLQLKGSGGALTTSLEAGALAAADIRDKEFLATYRAAEKRDLWLWRSFVACAAGLAAMLLLEAGLFAGSFWLKGLKGTVGAQAPAVQRIETAQALSVRIEEMMQRQLLPFEMLALINQNRPVSVQFVRTTTTGMYSLEIEAQTPQAADVGQYEAVLRAAPELAEVETRDLRSRDGVTSFILSVTFKPESLQRGTGS